MSIENEIAGLTQSTTDLLEAVNTKKATLDTAVSNAETAVVDATSQVSLAATEKVGAQTARDTAETFKDQAYTYSQSAASAVAYQDLTAIAETKAETAVDVFVYDTTKDSDGGAWRQRTQGTSWYNETLNTATRGSRKEFPAVAVIVAQFSKVTIYDGDDPSMPMWMVFNSGGGHLGFNNVSSVSMLNGHLFMPSGTFDLWSSNFIKDGDTVWTNTGTYSHLTTVADRNVSVSYPKIADDSIINRQVNDVAMTVLPDAPIDPATGLPIPTIAVATDGGVSVIKDDGTVVNSVVTGEYGSIEFSKENHMYLAEKRFADQPQIAIYPNWKENSFGLDRDYYYTNVPAFLWDGISSRVDALSADGNAFASNVGLGLFDTDFSKDANGSDYNPEDSVAYITSDYNTGWMNGDIKLATLSDTDDTDLVGSELVTNGTFDTDTSGWATTDAPTTISVENGRLKAVRDSEGGWGAPYYAFPSVEGRTYAITITIEAAASNGHTLYFRGSSAHAPTSPSIHSVPFSSTIPAGQTITTTQYLTATNVYSFLHVMGNVGDTWYLDNVSVRLVEADRSVNDNGLQVFGTVTREPVATGADLVAYSGFSTANYLEQPYNSDLDFGTGDFCVMGWVKPLNYGSDIIASRSYYVSGSYSGSFTSFLLYTGKPEMRISDGTTTSKYTAANALPAGVWSHIVFKRSSGNVGVYVNGILVTSGTDTKNVTNTSATLVVGREPSDTVNLYAMEGSLALWRVSGTAPTAEQIAKIYRDEKVLFQEGAQATLHGTSDAVTALAYDDTTELLHVGTSSGRSVFQGLQRVDNTTDAVGTAISASNNLVVEE